MTWLLQALLSKARMLASCKHCKHFCFIRKGKLHEAMTRFIQRTGSNRFDLVKEDFSNLALGLKLFTHTAVRVRDP